jgi:ubiquinone/menaquinone biosynthesis C-methylase UbiE
MQLQEIVNWNIYAQKYDMLLEYNPFHQQLHQEVMEVVQRWEIQVGDFLADIGAGTGSFSLSMASYIPRATILHIEKNEGMNAQAGKKKEERGLANHNILQSGIDGIQLDPASLKGLISIHALCTLPDPQKALRQMYEWLEPGGKAVLVNAGRMVNVMDWQLAIGWHIMRQHGIRKMLEILREGRDVIRQYAYIHDMQRKGVFWTHTHQEFCRDVQNAGFDINFSKICFRGTSDFVVAEKQSI